MSNQSLAERVQSDLSRAVASGLLPEQVQTQAETLLERLERPVRVAVLGLPESGKSSVVNLLVGQEVVSNGVRLPTLQLSYGAEAQTVCTLPDGTKETLATTDAAEIAALSPVFVDMSLPLPALGKISILEVVAPEDPNALHRASQWAAKRAEVVLWCTTAFSDDEQRIWSQMPDNIKDFGLLLLTHMDVLQQDGQFDGIKGAVRTAALGEFNKILPIAVPDALAARDAGGNVDKDKMRNSGGSALISAVLKQVATGKRSVIDMAEVLLLQNEKALSAMPPAAEAPQEEVVAPEPAPAPVAAPQPVATPQPEAAPKPVEIAQTEARPEPDDVTSGIEKLRNLAAKRAAEEAEKQTLNPAARDAYQHVIQHLQTRATALSSNIQDMGETAPSAVIGQCVEDIQWLCDYLNDHGDDVDPSLMRARETAFDAADLVQLMEMEKQDGAALEAVTLLLQVKRELQADLAA
ncbi:MAG: hypothetical protein ACSHW1_05060 [Yoonia sp.]|uniref:hypothetical protein n=1 Tax=Yoonia sp. TaxID=2212373 RepID=UPI003EF6CDE7